jgi:hypothetical protein
MVSTAISSGKWTVRSSELSMPQTLRLRNCAWLCATVLLASSGASLAHAYRSTRASVAHAHTSPPARARSTGLHSALTSVNEYGSLRMQHGKGSTVAEKGVCWGSFNCSVLMQMTLSGTLVTAGFTAYLQGGSISGSARAHIRSATVQAAYFSGTVTLHGGTGSRSHASGVAAFQGTINRGSYALSIHISGRLSL